jgi:hypothetical protein
MFLVAELPSVTVALTSVRFQRRICRFVEEFSRYAYFCCLRLNEIKDCECSAVLVRNDVFIFGQ